MTLDLDDLDIADDSSAAYDEVKQLREQLANEERLRAQETKSLTAQVEAKNKRLDELETLLGDKDALLKHKDDRVHLLEQQILAQSTDIKDKEARIINLEERVAVQSEEIKNKDARIAKLEEQVGNQRGDIKDLQSQVDLLARNLERVLNELGLKRDRIVSSQTDTSPSKLDKPDKLEKLGESVAAAVTVTAAIHGDGDVDVIDEDSGQGDDQLVVVTHT